LSPETTSRLPGTEEPERWNGTLALMGFEHGDVILRREVWRGKPHLVHPVRVVEDTGDHLIVYLAAGTPLISPEGSWPWSETHPWAGQGVWKGHGVLQLLSAVVPFSVWVFWEGPDRRLDAWYINLQEPFRRVDGGIDTQDLELDFVLEPDGSWHRKDDDLLDAWVEKGRWTTQQVVEIREIGAQVERALRAGHSWWDKGWAAWEPPEAWDHPGHRGDDRAEVARPDTVA
jgi:hypothetical protein